MNGEQLPVLSEKYYALMGRLTRLMNEFEKEGFRVEAKVFKVMKNGTD